MNEEANESFIDIPEQEEQIDEEEAREIFKEMLLESEINIEDGSKTNIPEELIKEFRLRTKLSIRKIAEMTKLNKDKINKALNR